MKEFLIILELRNVIALRTMLPARRGRRSDVQHATGKRDLLLALLATNLWRAFADKRAANCKTRTWRLVYLRLEGSPALLEPCKPVAAS